MKRIDSLPEVYPQVTFGIGHGDYVDFIDVDFAELTRMLRDEGLSDDEIRSLEINFQTEELKHDSKVLNLIDRIFGNDRFLTTGDYRKPTSKSSEMIRICDGNTLNYAQSASGDKDWVDDYSSEQYSTILAHEIAHAGAFRDPDQQIANDQYKQATKPKKLVTKDDMPVLLGGVVAAAGQVMGQMTEYDRLSGSMAASGLALCLRALMAQMSAMRSDAAHRRRFEQYLNHPEEIRAREAELAAPKGLVEIISKS